MIKNLKTAINLTILLLILFPVFLSAQGPGTYFNTINTASPTFVDDLKARIRTPYTKISYDNFDETNIANFASYDKGDGTRGVRCVYSYYEYTYTGTFTWDVFSREHTFCHSWMPTYDSKTGNEYADQHHLFPTHQNGANGVRNNHPLDTVVTVTSSFGEAKYGKNSLNQNVYEPRPSHKGDAARALLYMMLRYDDLNGKQWDFDWLNNTRLPSLGEAPQNLNRLIQWHYQDPPDAWEISRNDYIQSIQGNRNPFVDHPEYVDFINFNNMTYNGTPSSNTVVNFISTAGSVSESGGSYTLTLTIQSPSATLPCSVDVALTSGDASYLGNYSTQRVIFPAGSSANQTVSVTITDNSILEDDKVFTFSLQNISGGTSAEIGTNNTFNLTVLENETSLYISEYSDASNATGLYVYEFIEFFNNKNTSQNVGGFTVWQMNSAQNFTIPSGTIIPAKGFLVLSRDSDQSAFETYWAKTLSSESVVFVNTGNKMPLINGDETYLLKNGSVNIDPQDGSYTYAPISASGGTRSCRIGFDNTSSDWISTNYASATPGALETDSPLPVELTSFTATAGKGTVILKWSTATETNNFGFYVETCHGKSQVWQTIAFVQGAGNSNSPKEYSYTDNISPASVIKYRLRQVDNDGTTTFSKEISINSPQPLTFELSQNYPNPFNPSTIISYRLPRNSEVKLKIFDILGNEIKTIINETQSPGNYSIEFNGNNLPSGIYFYTLFTNEFTSTKRMSLIK